MQPGVPLSLVLVYENGTEVHSQNILQMQADTQLVTNEQGRANLKVRKRSGIGRGGAERGSRARGRAVFYGLRCLSACPSLACCLSSEITKIGCGVATTDERTGRCFEVPEQLACRGAPSAPLPPSCPLFLGDLGEIGKPEPSPPFTSGGCKITAVV